MHIFIYLFWMKLAIIQTSFFPCFVLHGFRFVVCVSMLFLVGGEDENQMARIGNGEVTH